MSTILPLEVVFGRSTWSLKSGFALTNERPDLLPSNPLSIINFNTDNQFKVTRIESYLSQYDYRGQSFDPPVRPVPFDEGLGTLTPDWHAAIKPLYDYSSSFRYSNYNEERLVTIRQDLYDLGRGGALPDEVWHLGLDPDYISIAPFLVESATSPLDDPGSPPWEEVLLTGECGSGGGSERPEYGLLYPRKV